MSERKDLLVPGRGDGDGVAVPLDALNSQLLVRFRELRSARPNYPLFGLEHGLESTELRRLFDLVGAEVRRFGISKSWRKRPYPLIAASSEIGYDYRGTGTDFWPRFEAAIGASLGSADRQQHSDVFEIAHTAFGIRKPAASPWSRAFRHIAWPIANAVAPKEIHRPLAKALREVFLTSGSRQVDQDLVAELRFAARNFQSSRFSEWLADDGLVAAVVMHLLELDDPECRLSAETAERILKDLESDPTAKRAVRSAVRLHRKRPATGTKLPTLVGNASFMLCQEEGYGSSLWLRLPPLPPGVRHQLKAAFTKQAAKPRLWGMGADLDVDTLASGMPLALEGIDVAQAFRDQRRFINAPERAGDDGLEALISALAPGQSDPIVFRARALSGEFEQVLGDSVALSGLARILTSRNASQDSAAAELPAVAGFRCFEVDTSTSGGREWLRKLGIAVTGIREIEIFGGIRLSDGLKGPVFAEGLPLLLQLAPTSDEGEISCRANVGPLARTAGPSPAVVAHLTAGSHTVEIEGRGLHSQVRFEVVKPESELEPLSVSIEPLLPTIDDFLRQQIVFRVSAPVSGAALDYRVSLAGLGGAIGTASGIIEKLPATVSSSDPVLTSLAEQLRQAPPPRDSRMELLFEIGPHWTQRWQLDWEPTVVHWEEAEGVWRSFGDEDRLPFSVSQAAEPLAAAVLEQRYEEDGQYSLLVPLLDGHPQLLDGICVGPRSARLGTAVSVPSRVGRQRMSVRDAVGFVPVVDAYLGWRLSSSSHLLATMRSRAVSNELERLLVRQLCGQRWVDTETRTPLLQGGPWSGLARVAYEAGLAAGADLPDVSDAGKAGFLAILARHLKLARPALWDGHEPPEPDSFAEAMDLAVIDAYEELGRLPENDGKPGFDDVDTMGEPAAWQCAYRDTIARQSGRPLAELILPGPRAIRLLEADYSLMLADEVHAMIEAVHLDLNSKGTARWLLPENLRAGLLLWINPAQLVRSDDWKKQLTRFLDDRPTSRAIRYAALRYRASRNLLEGAGQP